MALIAHWPLTGNLNEITGSNYTLTDTSSSSVISTGKIGQTYQKTGGSFVTNLNVIPDEVTISLWFRHNSTDWLSECLFGTRTGNNGFMLYRNDGDTDGYYRIYYWYVNTSGSVVGYNTWPGISGLSASTWYHFTLVRYSDGRLKLYKDGVLEVDQTPPSNFDYWHNNNANLAFHGQGNGSSYTAGDYYMNDFRVYDHALSAKEAKELAQGKVYHYNFNDYRQPTTNYVPDAATMSGWNSYSNGNDGTFVTEFGTIGYKIDGRNSWNGIYKDITVPSTGTYTFSAWFKYISSTGGNNGATVYINSYGGSDTAVALDKSIVNQWQRVSHTINVTDVSFRYYIISYGGSSSTDTSTWRVTMPQIEKKNFVTEFTEGTRDATVKDFSGFKNDAPMNVDYSPTWSSDSKIGTGSYDFLTERILYPNNHYLTDKLTLSCWFKMDTVRESGLIQSDFYLSIHSDGRLRAYWYGTSNPGYHSGTTYCQAGQWYHAAAVWTGTQCKIYLNGNLETTVNTNTPGRATNGYIAIGTENNNWPPTSGRQIHGHIDDVRIYGTALSDSDILDLYTTRAEIDNQGMFHLKDFEQYNNYELEVQNNNLVLNGSGQYGDLTGFSSFTGYDSSQNAFYKTSGSTSIFTDYFIEIKGNGIDQFDEYVLEAEHKQPSGTMSRYYFMIACYDKNFNFINNYNVTENSTAARTTLAQALSPGDTVLYLTSSSSWSTAGAGSYHYTQQFAIFPDGYEYPDYTYSRIHGRYTSVSGNTLNLQSAWSGDTIPAGSRIMNTRDGGTYSYIAAGNALMTTDWVKRSATTTTGQNDGSMRAGSKYVRVGWLMNRNAGTETSYVRNVRFYNITNKGQETNFILDKGEIKSTAVSQFNDFSTVGITDGLVGYWPLKGNVQDYSGYNRHGTEVGGVTPRGDAYYFDGVNDVISFGTGNTFFPLRAHTISVMFASDGTTATTGTNPALFGFTYGIRGFLGSSGEPQFSLYKTTGSKSISSGVSGLHDGQWHLYTATCDGGIIKIYVDGEYKAQGDVSSFWDGYTSWPTNSWNLGRDNNNSMYFFRGKMKQLKLFDRALTDKEIAIEANLFLNEQTQITKDGILYAKDINQY